MNRINTHTVGSDKSTDCTTDEVECSKEDLLAVIEQQAEKIESLEEEISSVKADFEAYRGAMSKKLDSLKSQTETETEPEEEEDEVESLPIDRISEEGEESGIDITSSVDRAVSIMENWRSWSRKSPKGRNIKTGLKRLLEAERGEKLAWNQCYRACKKLEQLTKGKIVFSKHEKHGWMLLQPSSVGG